MPISTTLPEIRFATPADADALAHLGERTFRETFAADNNPDDLNAFLSATFAPALQLREIEDPTRTFFVAEANETLVAYAQLLRGAVPDCVNDADAVEVLRFYVDKSWHGTGLAQRLMERCLAHIRETGAKTVYLGVWERNVRAIRFYEAQGYRVVGTHVFMVGSDPQTDHYLARSVSV
jgi:diamine N-acetyltransferase